MIGTNIHNQETTMLEFIGILAIFYAFLMGLERLIRGKQPTREIYIIQEYASEEGADRFDGEEQLFVEEDSYSQDDMLPDNVVLFDRKKR